MIYALKARELALIVNLLVVIYQNVIFISYIFHFSNK